MLCKIIFSPRWCNTNNCTYLAQIVLPLARQCCSGGKYTIMELDLSNNVQLKGNKTWK